jgi:hypothetical protein
LNRDRACSKVGAERITHLDLRQLLATRDIESWVDIPAVMTRPGKVATTSLRKRQSENPALAAPKKLGISITFE